MKSPNIKMTMGNKAVKSGTGAVSKPAATGGNMVSVTRGSEPEPKKEVAIVPAKVPQVSVQSAAAAASTAAPSKPSETETTGQHSSSFGLYPLYYYI